MRDIQVHVRVTKKDKWDKHPIDSFESEEMAMKYQDALINTHWAVCISEYTKEGHPMWDRTKHQNGVITENIDFHPGEKSCPIHKVEYRSQISSSQRSIHGICDYCANES